MTLVLTVAMIGWGWHQHSIPGLDVPDPLMYTNLTSHLFWVWWLMGIVFIALLFGRLWCAVCPLGWLNGIISRFGLRQDMPGWLRSFIPVTLVLIGLQLSVYFFKLHRFPDYTAFLLTLCLLLVVGVGLIFKQRAFCRLFCPAGAVFGLYARVAPFQLRVKQTSVCFACDSQRCVSEPQEWQRHQLGANVLYQHRRLDGCPVDLVPADLHDSVDCTLCLNCYRNCDKDNIKVGFRSWLADIHFGLGKSETLFFLVLLGMLTANFSKVYVELRFILFWLPQEVAVLFGWQEPGYYVLAAVWIALLLPLLFMLPGYIILRVAQIQSTPSAGPEAGPGQLIQERESGFWSSIGQLALPMIPALLTAHVVLAIVKINAKAAYLPFAFADSTGVKSFLAMNVMQTVSAPGVILPLDILKWVVLLLLIAGLIMSLLVARRVAVNQKRPGFLPAALISVLIPTACYFSTVIEWLFVR
jgi:polyferredoxin